MHFYFQTNISQFYISVVHFFDLIQHLSGLFFWIRTHRKTATQTPVLIVIFFFRAAVKLLIFQNYTCNFLECRDFQNNWTTVPGGHAGLCQSWQDVAMENHCEKWQVRGFRVYLHHTDLTHVHSDLQQTFSMMSQYAIY